MNHMRIHSMTRIYFTAAAAVIVATLVASVLTLGGRRDGTQPLTVARVEYVAVTDFSDDRRLVGFADDVFLGRVLGHQRTVEREPITETEFRVEVIEAIKGSLGGEVVVTQHGGYVAGRHEIQLMEGDRLLEPGRTYLFATKGTAAGTQLLVPEFGDVEVRTAAHREDLRRRFIEARKNEVRYQPSQ